MAQYKEDAKEKIEQALELPDSIDMRTKEGRRIKNVEWALQRDFDSALKAILEYEISLNMYRQHYINNQDLENGNYAMSTELKNIRKDTFDRLKLLEKLNKNKKLSKDDKSLANLILGDNDD